MGWYVIANVTIDTNMELTDIDIETIKSILRDYGYYDFGKSNTNVWFSLSGNKWVDYECLDKIKAWLKGKKASFEINATEYVESCDGGYHYDSNDEE
jgi:hypothetical protein